MFWNYWPCSVYHYRPKHMSRNHKSLDSVSTGDLHQILCCFSLFSPVSLLILYSCHSESQKPFFVGNRYQKYPATYTVAPIISKSRATAWLRPVVSVLTAWVLHLIILGPVTQTNFLVTLYIHLSHRNPISYHAFLLSVIICRLHSLCHISKSTYEHALSKSYSYHTHVTNR